MNEDEMRSEANPLAVPRVEATPAMKQMLSDSFRDLIAGYPYLASLASSESVFYHVVNKADFPMAATDSRAIYLNAKPGGWFDKMWTPDNRVFVHGHEVLHIMREDPMWLALYNQMGYVPVPRTPACPDGRLPFKRVLAEQACDAIINASLIHDGVGKPPENTFLHAAITHAKTFGEAYAILYREDEDNGDDGDEDTDGSGKGPPRKDPNAGDTRDPGSMGDPEGDSSEEASQPQDPREALATAQEQSPERQVAQQRAANAARQAGHGTSAAEQMVARSRAPGVDWRSYVQGFLARAAGNSAYDWRRPSRPPMMRAELGQQPYFAPSRGGNGVNHVMFVGDVSGSIGEAEHRATLASAFEMLGDLRPRFVSVVWCDSEIMRIDTFSGSPSEDELEAFYNAKGIPDGGGTSFIPPFELAQALALGGTAHIPADMPSGDLCDLVDAGKPDGLIYFTDLYGPAPAEAPDFPVLWLVTTDKKAPWGEQVKIDPQTLV